ncbi:heat repeat-containing protein, partial [Cystoisospora suis]
VGSIAELSQGAAAAFLVHVLPEILKVLGRAGSSSAVQSSSPREGVESEALELLSEGLRAFEGRKDVWREDAETILFVLYNILQSSPSRSSSLSSSSSSSLPLTTRKKAAMCLGLLAVL